MQHVCNLAILKLHFYPPLYTQILHKGSMSKMGLSSFIYNSSTYVNISTGLPPCVVLIQCLIQVLFKPLRIFYLFIQFTLYQFLPFGDICIASLHFSINHLFLEWLYANVLLPCIQHRVIHQVGSSSTSHASFKFFLDQKFIFCPNLLMLVHILCN